MMNDLPEFCLVDVFTRQSYAGNTAGVVLHADALSDGQMQAIATELNMPMTVFVLASDSRDAAVRFRWFTTTCESGFCGHATLGGVHALLESGRFIRELSEPGSVLPIQSRTGVLTIRLDTSAGKASPAEDSSGETTIWLDMPRCEPKAGPVLLPPLLHQLGLQPDDLDARLPAFRTQDDDVILAVAALPRLLELRPTLCELARHCEREQLRGVFVTCLETLSRATRTQSRYFAPSMGLDEDAVTGSLHGPLGLHLISHGIVPLIDGRADFHCAQAKPGGRAGLVRVVVTKSSGGQLSVRIGGTCITTARGRLVSLPQPNAD